MGAVQPHRRMRCARDHTAVYGAGASQALSMEQARALRHRGRRRARMTPREFCLLDTRNDWLYQCPTLAGASACRHAAHCHWVTNTCRRDVRPMSCPRRPAGDTRARTTGRPGPRRRRRRPAHAGRAAPSARARLPGHPRGQTRGTRTRRTASADGLKVVPPHIKRDRVNMSALVCIETARTDTGGAAPSCARFVTRHDDRFCNAVTRTHSGVQPHDCARPVRPTSRSRHHTPPLIQQ